MTTAPVSSYPRDVDALLPAAREMAEKLGEIPSRNRLMREFRVGAPKAQAVRDALLSLPVAEPDDTTAEPATDPWEYAEPAPVLPVVPDEPTPVLPVVAVEPPAEASPLATGDGHPDVATEPDPVDPRPKAARPPAVWPVVLLALPAFVAIWSGWVGLGGLTGFGPINPLPGIWDELEINTAVTLPIGMETYAAYALWVWLSGRVPDRARRFAKWSAIVSLLVGALGQVAYHLLAAAGVESAPWQITTLVACLPVAVLGMGAALAHMVRAEREATR
jgi:hypothetical protein